MINLLRSERQIARIRVISGIGGDVSRTPCFDVRSPLLLSRHLIEIKRQKSLLHCISQLMPRTKVHYLFSCKHGRRMRKPTRPLSEGTRLRQAYRKTKDLPRRPMRRRLGPA